MGSGDYRDDDSPAPAAGEGGEAERKEWDEAQRILEADAEHRRRAGEDASSYRAALSEVLGDAPPPESGQDDYTGALAALERQAAERERQAAERKRQEAEEKRIAELKREAEREAEREAALRAEKRELREMHEREAAYQEAREAERANNEALRQWGNTFMQQGITLQRQRQAEERRRARANSGGSGSSGGFEWEGGSGGGDGRSRTCGNPGQGSCATQ